ncbi:MAG: hypothetical protein ABEN55_13400 [Bradymonadaceae bacterium]
MKTDKEKATADGAGSRQKQAAVGSDLTPTISSRPAPVNPARSRLDRILDVATDLQHDDGHPGQYTRSGRDVYWLDARSCDANCVATIDDTGDLVILPVAREGHPNLALAAHLKAETQECGGALVVEGVAS